MIAVTADFSSVVILIEAAIGTRIVLKMLAAVAAVQEGLPLSSGLRLGEVWGRMAQSCLRVFGDTNIP